MTDKQIIIDGVDVAECKYLTSEWDFNNCGHICKGTECKYKRLWYKKQLARKEQEVQQAMDNYVQLDLQRVKEYNELVDLYKAKEQECEELKEKVKKYGEINEQETKDYAELKAENEELKKANKHIEHNRNQKADKLMRIEKLITACSTGYTDEFIQELLVILHEPEPNSFENKYKATLAEIKEIAEGMHNLWINKTPYTDRNNLVEHLLECELNRIRYKLDEISECEENNEN